MRDERYFSNPHRFIPTRWIESEQGNETCVKATWVPFGRGLRDCVGRPYVSLDILIQVGDDGDKNYACDVCMAI